MKKKERKRVKRNENGENGKKTKKKLDENEEIWKKQGMKMKKMRKRNENERKREWKFKEKRNENVKKKKQVIENDWKGQEKTKGKEIGSQPWVASPIFALSGSCYHPQLVLWGKIAAVPGRHSRASPQTIIQTKVRLDGRTFNYDIFFDNPEMVEVLGPIF